MVCECFIKNRDVPIPNDPYDEDYDGFCKLYYKIFHLLKEPYNYICFMFINWCCFFKNGEYKEMGCNQKKEGSRLKYLMCIGCSNPYEYEYIKYAWREKKIIHFFIACILTFILFFVRWFIQFLIGILLLIFVFPICIVFIVIFGILIIIIGIIYIIIWSILSICYKLYFPL